MLFKTKLKLMGLRVKLHFGLYFFVFPFGFLFEQKLTKLLAKFYDTGHASIYLDLLGKVLLRSTTVMKPDPCIMEKF